MFDLLNLVSFLGEKLKQLKSECAELINEALAKCPSLQLLDSTDLLDLVIDPTKMDNALKELEDSFKEGINSELREVVNESVQRLLE